MVSNFTEEQNAARDSCVLNLDQLSEHDVGFIEGYIVRMIAQKGA